MPVDISHVKLNDPNPTYDQLVRDWAALTAPTAPLPLVEAPALLPAASPAWRHWAPVRSHRAPGMRARLLAAFLTLNPIDILVFGLFATAYTSIVLGLVLGSRP